MSTYSPACPECGGTDVYEVSVTEEWRYVETVDDAGFPRDTAYEATSPHTDCGEEIYYYCSDCNSKVGLFNIQSEHYTDANGNPDRVLNNG